MTDRRGSRNWREHTRSIEYCAHCGRTTTFQSENNGLPTCIGDQRANPPRQGCGNILPVHPSRIYGNCLKCRQDRRAFKAPDGKAYCCFCLSAVINVESFGDEKG